MLGYVLPTASNPQTEFYTAQISGEVGRILEPNKKKIGACVTFGLPKKVLFTKSNPNARTPKSPQVRKK